MALIAILHQKVGESTGSPVASGDSSGMSSERARVMIMGQKEKKEAAKLSRSQGILNIIEADEKPWPSPIDT
jgi:hypothetical protein